MRDYGGVVMCDGYSAYASLSRSGGRFGLAHCMAHVRRKFFELCSVPRFRRGIVPSSGRGLRSSARRPPPACC
ncbi:MAG: IS66 family transposase [Myxococcales bacterium]